jgi:Rrf2 family protein
MVYIASAPAGKTIGVQPLAEFQQISPTYLSKILTKLVKAGYVESTPGVRGGYKLLKNKEDISFLHVIQAIEGNESLFQCGAGHDGSTPYCMIECVMGQAEQEMEQYLQQRTIAELVEKSDERILSFVNRVAQ